MTDQPDEQPSEEPQQVRSNHIGALVPAHVARGVFSTGIAILQGSHEFIIDFLLQMQHPQQVAARLILPPPVVGQFIQALRENIAKHEARFGPIRVVESTVPWESPRSSPTPATTEVSGSAASDGESPEATGSFEQSRPSAEDLYDQLRLPEDVMSGCYANAVMIGHTANEFSFDFITTFYPRSAVVQRVFLSAANVPRLLDSLTGSFEQFQQRLRNPPPPGEGPGSSPPGRPEDN